MLKFVVHLAVKIKKKDKDRNKLSNCAEWYITLLYIEDGHIVTLERGLPHTATMEPFFFVYIAI